MTKEAVIRKKGRVIVNYGAAIAIEDDTGTIIKCTARKKLGQIVCGDLVLWEETDNGDGVISEICPRTSLLSRPDQRGKLKTLAANIDQLIIVSAVRKQHQNETASTYTSHPETSVGREFLENANLIDHYLVAAENIAITPIILVNKIDFLDRQSLAALTDYMAIYSDLDYSVVFTSVKNQSGLKELAEKLHGRTSIFVGESGAGKSSLINIFLPDKELRVGALSSLAGKGKHTTTATTLYSLPETGCLIDSPGVREFGLWNISQTQLVSGFKEFDNYIGQCKFRNCQHQSEPECAITRAVSEGDISPFRYASYSQILQSLNKGLKQK